MEAYNCCHQSYPLNSITLDSQYWQLGEMILKVQLTSLHLSSALISLCPGCRKSNRKWPLLSMMIRPLHTYNSTKITNDLKCHIDRLSLIYYTHSHIYIVVLIQFQSSCLALQLCNSSVGSCPHKEYNIKIYMTIIMWCRHPQREILINYW